MSYFLGDATAPPVVNNKITITYTELAVYTYMFICKRIVRYTYYIRKCSMCIYIHICIKRSQHDGGDEALIFPCRERGVGTGWEQAGRGHTQTL